MNKNSAIFILVVLLIIGGIWGSLADRKRIVQEKKLNETIEQMQKLTEHNTRQREQVLGKTAELQESLAVKDEQLGKARKELVSLRKEIKVLESQISDCNATIQKLSEERNALLDAPRDSATQRSEEKAAIDTTAAPGIAKNGKEQEQDKQHLREQLQTAELTNEKLRRQLDAEKAQMMGLEKLLEEKNSALEEISHNMDRLQINMDVLLSKIADQRDAMQEIQEDNRNLVKELAARNEEIADLQEEVMRQPVQE